MHRILFILPYPLNTAPSQRFRVEQFLHVLKKAGMHYRVSCFLDQKTWTILYRSGSLLKKVWGIFCGFVRRFHIVCFVAPQYTHVFIHREAAPLGPPIFEWILVKVLRKKIVYDFDDAIWIPNTSKENKLAAWIKCFSKVKSICSWSYKVVAGNPYLMNWALRYQSNIILIPTCVDTQTQHNQLVEQQADKVIIGWTGSHSTMKYLTPLVPILEKITIQYYGQGGPQVSFVIISNKVPDFQLERLKFIPWSTATEIEDLSQIDIGLMPLESDAWSEGKCGFKLIQYMALGIPAVASPVGVNKEIVQNGLNGYLCNTEEEWMAALTSLIEDVNLRKQMGRCGRKHIVANYSLDAHSASFLSLFT